MLFATAKDANLKTQQERKLDLISPLDYLSVNSQGIQFPHE